MKHYVVILLVLIAFSCKKEVKEKSGNEKLKIVSTTSQVTDLIKAIAGDLVALEGLMGAGVDPHLYKASEGDVSKFFNADVIFYSGLHLEGKLEDVFEKMSHSGKKTIAVSDAISKDILISSADFASSYDPHFWFSVTHWKKAANYVASELGKLDPINETKYTENAALYVEKLIQLENGNAQQLESLPKEKRILVTAHDAFAYFGKAYDFQVVSLQGLSTTTEAGVQDVQRLSSFIIEHNIKAIFIESSVPVRTVEALQAAVRAKDHQVEIGGTLYSDALGDSNSVEGTYVGMYEYNMKTIINALK